MNIVVFCYCLKYNKLYKTRIALVVFLYKRDEIRVKKLSISKMMTSSDGFHLTLPSDGSHETFPDNTLSHYKTRLPQPIDLTEGEWEMGLTEMIYPSSLDNITTKENFVDLLIPWQQRKNVKDPNGSTTNRYKLEKIGGQTNHIIEHTLVPWRDSYWHQNFTLLSVGVFQIFRIHFRSGPYPQAQGLVDEINLGINRCLQDVYQIWEILNRTRK